MLSNFNDKIDHTNDFEMTRVRKNCISSALLAVVVVVGVIFRIVA